MAIIQFPGTDFHDLNLDWILGQMKNLLTEWAQTKTEWQTMQGSNAAFVSFITSQFDDFKEYVENYLANLPISDEISEKINQMIDDGTFLELIVDPAVPGEPAPLQEVVGDWLDEHITQETGYVIDDTLTIQGAAADAKATGDAITDLRGAISVETINKADLWESGNIGGSTGSESSSTSRMRTKGYISDAVSYIKTTEGKVILYAWNGETFVGIWTGSGFEQTTSIVDYSNLDIAAIRTTYPAYSYRLVWYLSGSYTPTPSTDYAKIIFKTAIRRAIDTVDETAQTALNTANDLVAFRDSTIISNQSTASIWQSGNIGGSSGSNSNSTTRMRTITYISDTITAVHALNGRVILYAWSGDTYMGIWTGSGFEKTTSITDYANLDIAAVRAADASYAAYKFRLVWYVSGSYTVAPSTDYANILLYNAATESAYMSTLYGQSIVFMGDSIFGLHSAPVDIPSFIAEATGATCYNCAFPGTRAVTRDSGGKAKFDLTTLIDAMVAGDYTEQDAVKEAATGSTDYDHLPTLETVDFAKVSIISLSYGTNDYYADVPLEDGEDPDDITTYYGALRYAIDQINTTWPHIRIFVCTPIMRSLHEGNLYIDADTQENANGKTLLDFVHKAEDAAKSKYVSCIDNHYIGINSATRTTYTTDGTHPNETGRRLIARNMSKELY